MTAVFPALAGLPGIGLAELTEHAALLSRVDRKYVLPTVDAGGLIAELAPAAAVLEIDGRRHFTYESLYFDTGGDLQVRDRARRPAHRPAGRAVAAAPRPAFHHRERN